MSTRNLDALFSPKTIALIGASNRPGSVGEVLARNLFGAGFEGPVMPVNPHETAIRSAVNFRSVSELPLTPDLAVIATPAPGVPAIVDELGRRGCRAAVVISAGFDEGTLRRDLLEAARPHLLRVVGPNCIGFLSPVARINASFVHLTPKPGDIAFVTQSGAVASAVLDWADVREIGFSHVVSIGDTSDVDVGDLLDHLALDPRTRAILLYVEAIGDARKFMTAARIAARAKPVIVIKAGRGDAASDAVHDAAFRRAGMLRVETLRDLFEAVGTLASGLRPKGDRLAILTNGEGAGILAADALAALGGRLATLAPETRDRLAGILPAHGSAANPVDTLRDASAELYGEAVAALLADPNQDAVLVLHCPQAIVSGRAAAEASLASAAARPAYGCTPLLTCWLGERDAREARRLFAREGVPTYQTPDESVRAFMQLVDYRRNQDLLIETPPAVAPGRRDPQAAQRLVAQAADGEGRILAAPDAMALLAAYGIAGVETRIAASPAEAALIAAEIGFPVALKILSPDIAAKSDVGGVRLDLDTADMVADAADHMLKLVSERRPAARIEGFTVQRMIRRPRARELAAGVRTDPVFGPVLHLGPDNGADASGAAVGLPPLNRILAEDMMERARLSQPPGERRAVADVLVILSQMIADFDEIATIDIHPLLADDAGVVALDARIAVAPARGPRRARFAIQPYPGELEREVRSRAGIAFRLRPIRPEDEGAVITMIEASDPDDIRLRFFRAILKVGHAFAARLTQIDYAREMAFVAEADGGAEPPGTVLGVARLIMDPNEEVAEFGIMVRSDQKGRGLGSILMNAILDYGRGRGLRQVYGEVLAQNTTMLAMAVDLGFRREMHPEDPGLRRVVIDL
jgi:acetyltransferase